MEKRFRKNEEGLREMQENMKRNNIHIIGIPEEEGEEDDQGIENLFEASSQDGGLGRHTAPPHTTKGRTTTI